MQWFEESLCQNKGSGIGTFGDYMRAGNSDRRHYDSKDTEQNTSLVFLVVFARCC